MSIFSFLTLFISSVIYSLPIWSLLFCLTFIGLELSNVFMLLCLGLSLFLNVLDVIDLELEFFFFMLIFIYVSAILILFLFAFLALPINTEKRNTTKELQVYLDNIKSLELIIFCCFWYLFEDIDLLTENVITNNIDLLSLKTEFVYNTILQEAFSNYNWVALKEIAQNIITIEYVTKASVQSLSWFLLEEYKTILLIILMTLLLTVFGTIYWLRKTDTLEHFFK